MSEDTRIPDMNAAGQLLPSFEPLPCCCPGKHGVCRGDQSTQCFYRGVAQHQYWQERHPYVRRRGLQDAIGSPESDDRAPDGRQIASEEQQ
jgi:hypothetical protein